MNDVNLNLDHWNNPRIKVNKAQCLICGDVITSEYTHHLATCSCGNLSVDGGHSYLKRTYKYRNKWKELSEYLKGDSNGKSENSD